MSTRGRAPEPPPARPKGVDDEALGRVFRVPPEAHGMRVDVFVQSQLRNTSRTRARVIVENGAFTLQGRALRPSERVRGEDRIVLWRAPWDEEAVDVPLPILHEDDHLIAVDKPPLVAVHPSARYHKSTVQKRLEAERPGAFLSLIHRLDRETSGILLVAKTLEAERAFKRVLEERAVRRSTEPKGRFDKSYLAITWGTPRTGDYDAPLEADTDNSLRVKMRIAAPGTGLEARTRVEVLGQRNRYALVCCDLLTGRQHQIRIHLAAAGFPVVGDKLYGPDERMLARAADGELTDEDRRRLELPRHALHAHRYAITHAITGELLELESPLPSDLAAFWNGAREPVLSP